MLYIHWSRSRNGAFVEHNEFTNRCPHDVEKLWFRKAIPWMLVNPSGQYLL
jgi:hypothetical protein